jgi:hypothetical protein
MQDVNYSFIKMSLNKIQSIAVDNVLMAEWDFK